MSESPSYQGSGDLYVFLSDTYLHLAPAIDADGDMPVTEVEIVDEHGTQVLTLRCLTDETAGVAELLRSIADSLLEYEHPTR